MCAYQCDCSGCVEQRRIKTQQAILNAGSRQTYVEPIPAYQLPSDLRALHDMSDSELAALCNRGQPVDEDRCLRAPWDFPIGVNPPYWR